MNYYKTIVGMVFVVGVVSESYANCSYDEGEYSLGSTECHKGDILKECSKNDAGDFFWEDTFQNCQGESRRYVIAVSSAEYGNDQGRCDPEGRLRTKCDGKEECKLNIHSNLLCPDDGLPGGRKYLTVEYGCKRHGADPIAQPEAKDYDGQEMSLRCVQLNEKQ